MFKKYIIISLLFTTVESSKGQQSTALEKGNYTNDQAVLNTLEKDANKLIASGMTLSTKEVAQQLRDVNNKVVFIDKIKAYKKKLSTEKIAERLKTSLVSINVAYLCGSCDQTHIMPASGYIIDASGIIVTNHHVLDNYTKDGVNGQQKLALFVHTAMGKSYRVSEILSSSPERDLALLKVDIGQDKLTALPLGKPAPQGALVYLLSNPNSMFSYFSTGVVARNTVAAVSKTNKALYPEMQITADYAAGSSGAAVVDDFCNVIGTVSTTRSIYYNPKYNADLQMVVKGTKPVISLYDLIRFN